MTQKNLTPINYFFFCFKNDRQTKQLDFSLRTLFVIVTSCGLKL